MAKSKKRKNKTVNKKASSIKNKKVIKRKLNTIIDDTADLIS